jgi:hypothetical protein
MTDERIIGWDLASQPDKHVELVGYGHKLTPVDSAEGIALLIGWARAFGAVLNEYHERIAAKHGVNTEGVIFSRPIPHD